MKKKWLLYVGVPFLLLIILELYLRVSWGFCSAVLIQEDPDTEYVAQPDQHRRRFKNNINYNSLSMRSEEVDNNALHVLGFGDSVINGGSLTDQDSLATTMLSDSLTKCLHQKVQFLNISAGSWGPDNCFAYLKKHGDFSSKHIFLFVSSHDAYDNMDFSKIVGKNPNFPDKQYSLALIELLHRYIWPKVKSKLGIHDQQDDNLGINKKTENSTFNSGFEDLLLYCTAHQQKLTIYLHAETTELQAKEYNEQGQQIIDFCNKNNLVLIKDLDEGMLTSDYRDGIHLNERGQKKMAQMILGHCHKFICADQF